MEDKYFEGRWYNVLRNAAITLFAVTVMVIICSILLYADKWRFGYFETVAQWGAFGDFFGGVLNPLIAFTGVVLLAFTLYQNHIALSQTTKELRFSVEEMKKSAEATEGQRKLMTSEVAERQFLNLLSYVENKLNQQIPRDDYQKKFGPNLSFSNYTITPMLDNYVKRRLRNIDKSLTPGSVDYNLKSELMQCSPAITCMGKLFSSLQEEERFILSVYIINKLTPHAIAAFIIALQTPEAQKTRTQISIKMLSDTLQLTDEKLAEELSNALENKS